MPGWLLPVIVADLVITSVVVWFVFARRGARADRMLDVPFAALREFTDVVHPRIGEYVRANWSGMPDQLPRVLGSLLDEIERESRSRSLALDRGMLKLLLARSLASHGIGHGSDVRQALELVA
jgi:hypothetical protein